jgi:hypothetical protein
MNGEIPAANSEISHLLLFYAFLGGFAQDLIAEPGESKHSGLRGLIPQSQRVILSGVAV